MIATSSSSVRSILDKAIAGERISCQEALTLLQSADLSALGQAAQAVTNRLHPENYRTYNSYRNIKSTNVCTAVCDFFAFYRPHKSDDGYGLDRLELHKMIQETVQLG